MSDLYVDADGINGMIGALAASQDALSRVPTSGFIAAIETALPGSGLGHTYMKAGWRGSASIRGVGGQLVEINNAATHSVAEYQAQQQRQVTEFENLENGPR
ncbi:hypothetical protein ACFWPK_32950 [Nocardia sp. NPDC058519]|uniref:hypothetical protein n=1 Tax=unclassified Nocardia TaxID=2637762 RepID=UPI003669B33E